MMEISEFGKGILYFLGGIIFILLGFITSWLLRPHRPNPEKLTNYECGEDPVGNAWSQFNVRFYVMGLIFLIFDVELIMIFPWAYAFFDEQIITYNSFWNYFSFYEILFFILVLAAGLVYIWIRQDIDWVRPTPLTPKSLNIVPLELYKKFNNEKNSHLDN